MGRGGGGSGGEEERGVGAPRLLLNLGRAERHAVHKLLAHYFNRLASSPKQMVPSRFNVCFRFLSFSNCERSSSNCNYLHTRMGHIQTFTCIDVTPYAGWQWTYIHSDIPHKMWKALLVFCVGVVPKCEAVVHLGLAVLFFPI